MGIHVVRTVLRVIFYHENQRVVPVMTVRDLVHQQAERIVVVGHLLGKRIDAIDRSAKASEMVVHNTEKLQRWKVTVSNELVKLALPFLKPPEIRKFLVIAAEEGICNALKRRFGRERNHGAA